MAQEKRAGVQRNQQAPAGLGYGRSRAQRIPTVKSYE
jgi:hypothetical protein